MFRSNDMVRGNEGGVTITRGNNVKVAAYVRSFEMNADVADIERAMLGNPIVQHKKGLITLSGSITIDAVTSDFIDALIEYKRTRVFPPMTLIGALDDPESAAGARRVKFDGVTFNSIPLFLIDIGSDTIEETLDVTANDFTFLDKPTL